MRILTKLALFSIVIMMFTSCGENTKKEHTISLPEASVNSVVKEVSGKDLFRSKCMVCHKVGEEAINSIGPHLNNLFDRKIGSIKNFRYGESFLKVNSELDVTWNNENLKEFLTDPQEFIKKVTNDPNGSTKMISKTLTGDEVNKIVDYIEGFNTTQMSAAHVDKMKKKDERCIVDPNPNGDYSGCNLAGVDFSGADLSGADLKDTNLIGANLSKANLTGANLSGSTMAGADLRETNFESANLTDVKMVKAFLAKTNFSNAVLDNVIWVNGRRCATGSIGECK